MSPALQAIIEMRDEMREFRTETLTTLGQHSHRLHVIEASVVGMQSEIEVLKSDVSELKSDVSDIQTDVRTLLGTVPVINERLDHLEGQRPPPKKRQ